MSTSGPYALFMLVLSVFALAALAVATLVPLAPETRAVLEYADTAVCVLFFADFLLSLARAEHRGRYFLRWGWLDLLSSIPAVDYLRWGRAARILRILRLLRGVRAAKVVGDFLLRNRAQSAFLTALLLSLLLVTTSAVAVLQLETAPEANIRTAEDALWWAITTVTTVGYGDRYPVSSEGRAVAVLLMTAGVGLFGTFSGLVASWFLRPGEARQESDIEQLVAEVRELKEELRRQGGRELPPG